MKWSLMLFLTEPSQWWRPPRPCPLCHTLAPRNLRESHAELLSAMALLDFKTFLVLGYLPISDSLPFCLFFSVCVHFWIWLVFESVVFELFSFSNSIPVCTRERGRGEQSSAPCTEMLFPKQASEPEVLFSSSPAVSRGWACVQRGWGRMRPS